MYINYVALLKMLVQVCNYSIDFFARTRRLRVDNRFS